MPKGAKSLIFANQWKKRIVSLQTKSQLPAKKTRTRFSNRPDKMFGHSSLLLSFFLSTIKRKFWTPPGLDQKVIKEKAQRSKVGCLMRLNKAKRKNQTKLIILIFQMTEDSFLVPLAFLHGKSSAMSSTCSSSSIKNFSMASLVLRNRWWYSTGPARAGWKGACAPWDNRGCWLSLLSRLSPGGVPPRWTVHNIHCAYSITTQRFKNKPIHIHIIWGSEDQVLIRRSGLDCATVRKREKDSNTWVYKHNLCTSTWWFTNASLHYYNAKATDSKPILGARDHFFRPPPSPSAMVPHSQTREKMTHDGSQTHFTVLHTNPH